MKGITYIALLLCGSCFAQEWDTIPLEDFSIAIVEAEEKIDLKESFSYVASYNFYNDHTSTIPQMTEETTVTVLNGSTLHMTQMDRVIMQDETMNVMVDSATQSIAMSYPNPNLIRRKTSEDFTGFLSSDCIAMKIKTNTYTKYRIEFPAPARFLAAEVWINKNGTVRKYTMFGRKEILDDSGETEQRLKPRMEISYTSYRFGDEVDTSIPKVSDFISATETEIKLTPQFEAYELIDLRIPNE